MSHVTDTQDTISLTITDLSRFAKTLRAGLSTPPGHLETLNLIARAAGYRNYQHLKARQAHQASAPVDDRQVARALRFFRRGKFADWPAKTQVQKLCLWGLWAQLPAQVAYSEREVSDLIHDMCSFRDAAQIRRAMVEHKMLTRQKDGSNYQRVEQAPPPEALDLIRRLRRTD